MKKVFLKFQCKLLLGQLSTFIGRDINEFSEKDFLKLFNIIFKLYWKLFQRYEQETIAFLLLEDWLYYLQHWFSDLELHERMTNERMDDNFLTILENYMTELEERIDNQSKNWKGENI